MHELKPPFCFLFYGVRDQLYRTPAQLKSHTDDSGSFFGALGFTVPVEELTMRTALDGQRSQLANPAKGFPLGGWNIDPRLFNSPGHSGDP